MLLEFKLAIEKENYRVAARYVSHLVTEDSKENINGIEVCGSDLLLQTIEKLILDKNIDNRLLSLLLLTKPGTKAYTFLMDFSLASNNPEIIETLYEVAIFYNKADYPYKISTDFIRKVIQCSDKYGNYKFIDAFLLLANEELMSQKIITDILFPLPKMNSTHQKIFDQILWDYWNYHLTLLDYLNYQAIDPKTLFETSLQYPHSYYIKQSLYYKWEKEQLGKEPLGIEYFIVSQFYHTQDIFNIIYYQPQLFVECIIQHDTKFIISSLNAFSCITYIMNKANTLYHDTSPLWQLLLVTPLEIVFSASINLLLNIREPELIINQLFQVFEDLLNFTNNFFDKFHDTILGTIPDIFSEINAEL